MLLDYGANPNINDQHSRLPLLTAAYWSNPSMVKLLIDHGANPDLIDIDKANFPDDMKQFIYSYSYHNRPRYKEAVRECAQLNGISEDSELTIVSFLHGEQVAKDAAQKRQRWRKGSRAAERIMKKRQAKQRDMRSPKNMTLLVEVGLE